MQLEYIVPLRALRDLPFPVGKRLFMDFLLGNGENPSISKNRLYRQPSFGYFELYEEAELEHLMYQLFSHKLIERSKLNGKNITVLMLTKRGADELENPQLKDAINGNNTKKQVQATISAKEREAFRQLSGFLQGFDDEQKKAIISIASTIACIAGAGTGKTTVLTKRIEFLVRYRGFRPQDILAVTFTRKARAQMQERLRQLGVEGVYIHTFNSFCERFLRRHASLIYETSPRVITFRERISLFKNALRKQGLSSEQAIEAYFSSQKRRSSSHDELFFSLMNDCFGLRDLLNQKNARLEDITLPQDRGSHIVSTAMCSIDREMDEHGLRDYSDQLRVVSDFFENNPRYIPRFEHILVDEYQDVNDIQIQLLGQLAPANSFYVGDPRQSIYGWRGSRVDYLRDFRDHYPDAELIPLSHNYRSVSRLLRFANTAIAHMQLPDLQAQKADQGTLVMVGFESQEQESAFVLAELQRCEHLTFVLARTNRQLSDFSQLLSQQGIRHDLRTEQANAREDEITQRVVLSTVHAIKGMEADTVFLLGCGPLFFPCKVSDHPIFDELQTYDKEAEEQRLFYVAITRAERRLFITYTGKAHTPFVSPLMKTFLTHS